MAGSGIDIWPNILDLVKGEIVTFNDDPTRFVCVDEKTKTGGVFLMREVDLPPSYVFDAIQGCWLEL